MTGESFPTSRQIWAGMFGGGPRGRRPTPAERQQVRGINEQLRVLQRGYVLPEVISQPVPPAVDPRPLNLLADDGPLAEKRRLTTSERQKLHQASQLAREQQADRLIFFFDRILGGTELPPIEPWPTPPLSADLLLNSSDFASQPVDPDTFFPKSE